MVYKVSKCRKSSEKEQESREYKRERGRERERDEGEGDEGDKVREKAALLSPRFRLVNLFLFQFSSLPFILIF